MLTIASHADPLIISGTGVLQPEVHYTPPNPSFGTPGSLYFKEFFDGLPSTVNTAGLSDYIQVTLSAPEGYEITVAANTTVEMNNVVSYYGDIDTGLTGSDPVVITYGGLKGTAPNWIGSGSAWYQGFGFNFWGHTTEGFSFTSITFTMPIFGVGLDVTIDNHGTHELFVLQDPYSGDLPPNETALVSVTPVPEPGSFWLAAAGLCTFLALARRKKIRPGV